MASSRDSTELMIQNVSSCITDVTPLLEDDYLDSESSTYNPIQTALRTSFIVLNSLMVIIGNIFSLTVMRYVDSPRFPPSSKAFLCNVIVWDLAHGIFSILYVPPAALNYWPYGQFLCEASGFVLMFINFCCVNAAILITVDRLLAVLYPLRHPIMISTKRALAIIAIAVLFALSASIATFAVSADVAYSNDTVTCFVQWSRVSPANLFRLIVCIGCLLFLPAVILVGCYTKLYLVARKHAKRLAKLRRNASACGRNPGLTVTNSRALRMCLLITATFCIAWTPYAIVSTLNYVTGEDTHPLVDFITCWLCLCNSWWDVIIYFFMAQEFRKTARKLLCRRRL
ncbi:uracil nucleotide/cysteinyl leukotriene receptor-like [Patiria miniata]|uniref:G-protein coupled receptors family 1 profile domain-containing protein n=1 Tax=Patiria miniata TaxID=46514 RepID=A0A914BNN9_PATMI|nr:uracil nucleotide/cysteinyl leukotriene receptor-like [Patiria miniata]